MASDEKEGSDTAVTTSQVTQADIVEFDDKVAKERFTTVELCAKTDEKKRLLSYIVKDNRSKRQFSNEFEATQLKSMGLHQSMDQIANLVETAQNQSSGAKMSFQIGFGQKSMTSDTESDKNDENCGDEHGKLSLTYRGGDSLYIMVSINEAWFNGVFVFELKEQKRAETEVLDDRIEDVMEENEFLKKRMKLLENEVKNLKTHIMKPHVQIAQFKTAQLQAGIDQKWEIESIKAPMIDGIAMVSRENKNQDIVIGIAGLYNVIVRFGYQYYSTSFGNTSYFRLYLNNAVIGLSTHDAYLGASGVCFNEFLQLKKGDKLKFFAQHLYASVVNYNHFTIIKIGD